MPAVLTSNQAYRLAEMALANVTREFPNKLDHVVTGAQDIRGPRELHPIFYGSFDWHSCVHGYWTLARLYRRFPALRDRIGPTFDRQVTPENVAAELAYLEDPIRRSFERPYGMAWLLMLGAELIRCGDAARWRPILEPLVHAFVERTHDYLRAARYPVRAGTHSNSAFALTLALDYALASGDRALDQAIRDKARVWFANDANCPAWEPDGEDFLSPALTEALCMSRVLSPPEFRPWLSRFLPRIADKQPATLFRPVVVDDHSDLRFSHLDGLNLSRAWCWRALGRTFETEDPRAAAMAAADAHIAASLPHIGDNYAGSHWLASFALLALDG
jgi:hypothetical protein